MGCGVTVSSWRCIVLFIALLFLGYCLIYLFLLLYFLLARSVGDHVVGMIMKTLSNI